MKKLIGRAREKEVRPPPVPVSVELYVIPERYKTYSPYPGTAELFLLADSGDTEPDNKRVLILGRSSIRQWIHLVKKLYVDGTFKISPHHFSQVFVIMGERGGFVLPLCYALLPDKSQATYDKMFEMLVEVFPLLEPESISLDYEMAVINSVKKAYGNNIKLGGCLFHLSKNMKGHLKQHRRPARNGRRPPLFGYDMWSVYQRSMDEEGRTNNYAEAAHRRLQTELARDHPTLYALIDGLKKAQASRDIEYEEFVRGDAPPQKRIKYQQADARIFAILEDYENRTLIEILRGISQSYGMV
ncbi:MULE transposase domain-containing protein [Ditylenchus destructor]|nr:MULE transposase domain-containing protein [Ditylenchus destructor]